MKKLLLAIAFLVALGSANAATNGELFKLDEQQIAVTMADLNEIESYVNSHDVTLSELYAENNTLVISSLLPSYGATSIAGEDGPPLGIPSFVWGFCLSWVGILLVYLISENSGETKKALWGCIVGGLLYTVFYVLVYAAAWSTY